MPPIYVGTYAESGGPGLQRLGFYATRGSACEDAFPGARNASFGAYSTRHDLHYLVDEHQAGTVGVFQRLGDDWQEVARVLIRMIFWSETMSADPLPPPETDDNPAFRGNDDGTLGHYSGEEYDSYEKEQPRNVEVGVSRENREANVAAPNRAQGEDIPPDAGRRAYIDEKTGEVHGSGAGAGGGNATEDYDADTPGGGGGVRQTQQSK